jgi:pimeloyl-ACP methyl ester carboxylesterase
VRCGIGAVRSKTEEERARAARWILYAANTPEERIEEDARVRCSAPWSAKGGMYQFAGILGWTSYLRLPGIQVPTLVLHGDEDHLIPIQNGRTVAARIPGARFQAVPNAGHMLTTDQPEICLAHLTRFLAEQSASEREPVRMAS